MNEGPSLQPLGDHGVVLEFAHELSPSINARARALAVRLRDLPGVVETVPTLRSVLIVCDPLQADPAVVAAQASEIPDEPRLGSGASGRLIEVPVVYGGDGGPDLEAVAALSGVGGDELVKTHCAPEYLVYMLGFAPGFPYLGIVPPQVRAPRLSAPRVRVPAGSVGIAGALTGVYPLQTPGGWQVIGRTPLTIYNPGDPDPILFRPGDRVRFVPVHATFPVFTPPLRPAVRHPRPVLEVLEPGLFTTIQDLGRPRYRSLGLPSAGAMDPVALRLANAAVGNSQWAAAIECTAPGPAIRILDDATIAVVGADLSLSIDGAEAEMGLPIRVRPGQMVRYGAPRRGVWAYLAVGGGIDVPRVLGSASTFVPGRLGGIGRTVQTGDLFGRGETPSRSARVIPAGILSLPGDTVTVRAVAGPQADWFTEVGRAAFWTGQYRVTVRSDRAGIRLEGPVIARRDTVEMLSDGLLPGAVQVPSGGQPIVIMADGPTTGGYPKIAVVATVDVRLLAQARPGTRVRFIETTVERAVEALRERERALRDGLQSD